MDKARIFTFLCGLIHVFVRCEARDEVVLFINEDVKSVRLKCHETRNDTGPRVIQWDFRSQYLIIQRTPSGDVVTGDNFTGNVALEAGNDLILYYPKQQNTGIYTCTSMSVRGQENTTSYVYLQVLKAVSADEELRSSMIAALMCLDVILVDVNVLLLLAHSVTYRKHKDIWSLRLFFIAYHIIYSMTGLLFLLLYVVGRKSDFLYAVGATCSATSLPPVVILWIDYLIITKRLNKRRSRLSEDAFHEEMIPVIRTPEYLANGENGGTSRDGKKVRKRYNLESKPAKRSHCCSKQSEEESGLETVELTGHAHHTGERSRAEQT